MVYLMLHVWIEKSKFGEEMGWMMTCILRVLVRLLATSLRLCCRGLVGWWWDGKRILPIECIYSLHFTSLSEKKTNSGDLVVVVSGAGVWC